MTILLSVFNSENIYVSDMDDSCISCGEVVFGKLHVLQCDGRAIIFYFYDILNMLNVL